jgi:hypothetical protein
LAEYHFPPRPAPGDPPIPPLSERLRPWEAAALIGVSEATLRNWRCQRKGPAYYVVGRVFYVRSDVAAWLKTRRVNCHRS